ncbi:MAG: hypothetical protein WCX17_03505 [Parcubacteria group bacterium]|jgi:hypothetical protein
MISKIAEFMQKYGLALAVLVFVLLFVASLVLFSPGNFSGSNDLDVHELQVIGVNQKDIPQEGISLGVPKLSEVRGPSIDGEAAAVVSEEKNAACPVASKTAVCQTWPPEIWIFLLTAYLFLLIFNLGLTFGKRSTIQWVWEAIITLLGLGTWFLWDQCRTSLWYPLFVITLGILIYLFYLYFFNENLRRISDEGKKA